ncbi:MAG: 4-vinyl reductase [Defluviitaleaceae bacterium]|nr:4-vinyl reductase [Defluviitaleaceae bacterium]
MDNIFMQKAGYQGFKWEHLGDIAAGRGNMGEEMPVTLYRLMQFTMRDVLVKRHGMEVADEFFREAGYLAGSEFAKNMLDMTLEFDDYVADVQQKLQQLKVGMLRLESVSNDAKEIILTVDEDLDCSGLPITGQVVCNYDEGFIAAILDARTGRSYTVREIDCWANGDRTCRFQCKA